MTSRATIGYYVHHHGDGHADRFRAIAAASDRPIVPISERTDLDDGVVLPSDVPVGDADDPTAGGALHWAPLHPGTAAPRMKALLGWLDRVRPAGVVVDVSVEAALACRLAGFRTVLVRLHGRRDDCAHRLAIACATGLLAPYPPELETDQRREVLAKTRHVGFVHPVTALSPDRPAVSGPPPADLPSARDAVVLWGRGGGHLPGAVVDAVARTVDGRVYCAGCEIWPPDDEPTESNVVRLGWVPRPERLLAGGPLVVSSAGSNCVAVAARHRCPLVVVPLTRPFDEQCDHAAALVRAGVAVRAPDSADPVAWCRTVGAARETAPAWDRLQPDVDGAAAAAAAISDWLPR